LNPPIKDAMQKVLVGLVIALFFVNLGTAQLFSGVERFAGTAFVSASAMTLDTAGNIYIAGIHSGSTDFDIGPGTHVLTAAGDVDVFVVKLDSAGLLIWARQMGGSQEDQAMDIEVDKQGNVYTTGRFMGTADFDPSTGNSCLFTAPGTGDIFVSKLDSAGNFVWAQHMGGTTISGGEAIAVDNGANVFVLGFFTDLADFDPGPGVFSLSPAGVRDIFLAKLDSLGQLVWVKRLGGNAYDMGNDLALDDSANCYVIGNFQNTVDFNPDSFASHILTSASPNVADAFCLKWTSDGNFKWAKAWGNHLAEQAIALCLDDFGHAYMVGLFGGTVDFDPGSGSANLTAMNINKDIFVSKLDTAGNFQWARNMGGSGWDQPSAVTTDEDGNVYAVGYFQGPADFNPSPTDTFILVGVGAGSMQSDAFVVELDSSGGYLWAKEICGDFDELNDAIAVDDSGRVLVTGHFIGTVDFDPSASTYNLTAIGDADCHILGLRRCIKSSSPLMTVSACYSYLSPSGNQTWTSSGTYTDVMLNAEGCDSILTIALTIDTVDVSVLNTSPTLVSNATSAAYQWIYCDSTALPGDTSATFTATANGNYAVIVTQNGCTDTSACISVANVVGLEAHSMDGLQIYPNPTLGRLYIKWEGMGRIGTVRVYNAMGQIVLQANASDGDPVSLLLPGNPGMYAVEVQGTDGWQARRLVLKH
jgi:hypothetical protein